MQKPNRTTLLITAACAAILAAGASSYYFAVHRAHASSAPELLSLLPSDAPTLIYIDLAVIRESRFYQLRPGQSSIVPPSRDYAAFTQATGFNFEKDLDRVALAYWPASKSPERKNTMVLAEGRFNRQKIRDYAMRNGKVDHQQGQEVFQFAAENPNRWNSFVFLNDNRLAIVEGTNVSMALSSAPENAATNPALEHAARVAGAPVFAISRMPAFAPDSAINGMQSAQLANLLHTVEWVTLAALPEGDNLRVSLEGECKTATDARQLESTLDVLRLFGRTALDNPKTRRQMDPAFYNIAQTILKTAQISSSGERVRILAEFTPDILKMKAQSKTQ